MTRKERREAARKVAQAFERLPADRKMYYIGLANGVLDASAKREANQPEDRAG